MKRHNRLLIATLLLPVCAGSQSLRLYMNNNAFYRPDADSIYIETTLAAPGFALRYVRNTESHWQAAMNVYLQYERDTQVVATESYRLNTPPLRDTSDLFFTILDLRRIFLPVGEYVVRLYVSDANRPSESVLLTQGIDARFSRQQPAFSGITLVQHHEPTRQINPFSKYGYDIKPLAVPYLGPGQNQLSFYAEVYNTEKSAPQSDIVLFYSVRSALSHQVVQDLHRFSRQRSEPVNVLFSEFDISRLPTGSYYLHLEARNKGNELLAEQSLFFQRFHSSLPGELGDYRHADIGGTFAEALPADSMTYFLKCLLPIADLNERNHIMPLLKSADLQAQRQLFYAFWHRRSNQPEVAWNNYLNEVKLVNYYYSTPVQAGFETDRGRVYLQYGPPNSIEGHPFEAGAYPYEIWHYYKLGNNQRNVRFVFCNLELATNNYSLVHSDARGEIYDPRWRFRIYRAFRESSDFYNLDETRFRQTFGSQVDKLFER
ncbi:MAG: GWxTD domain-containing protein [Chitinophagales bacterium]|nr:GWxTD domain-containing protein [Chitinophagales bacterium]MDW8392765.1 GWxTD domain-containing protein [Chitinophagales bacterium]